MIFSVKCGYLRKAIGLAQSVVVPSHSIPSLRSVRLSLDEDKNLILIATDSHSFISVMIPDSVVDKTEPATQFGYCFDVQQLWDVLCSDEIMMQFHLKGVNPDFCDGINGGPMIDGLQLNKWRIPVSSGENCPRFFPRNPMAGHYKFDPDKLRTTAKMRIYEPEFVVGGNPKEWGINIDGAWCPGSMAVVMARDDVRFDGIARFGREALTHKLKFASFPFVFDGHMPGVLEAIVREHTELIDV